MTTAAAGGLRSRRAPLGRALLALTLLAVAFVVAWGAVHQAMPGWYARMWYPLDHAEVIRAEAAANGVTPDLVAGVIYRESRFSESARSDRGAVGLMQVLPETAAWIHDQPGGPAAEPERLPEPRVNIAYGVWYLAYLLREYDDVAYALAAYNGGEANLRGWIADARARGDSLEVPEIPFPETRGFVTGVLQAREDYRRAWGARLERG